MTVYGGKIVAGNGNPLFKLGGLAIAALIVIILLSTCVTRASAPSCWSGKASRRPKCFPRVRIRKVVVIGNSKNGLPLILGQ